MSRALLPLAAAGLLAVTACGRDDAKTKNDPAPVTPGTSDETFSLQNGTYYLTALRDLEDGCGKQPLSSDQPITQVPFQLTNDGNGRVTMDFCSYDGRSVEGAVRGNEGTLSVVHPNRRIGDGADAGELDQDCRLDLEVTADNQATGRYVESQRNRNEALRAATVDVPSCTTSFAFDMVRRR